MTGEAGAWYGLPGVGLADGRLEVFGVFGDGTIRCTWQNRAGDDNNNWSDWLSLGVLDSPN
ncbi:hypothetical protein M2271_000010 [Streptomyces sp. LBL]|uniref:hypothetical protein n=1 Tax=Streptomyces sp. LBL TaxID=2940562 RepID=UPI0024766E59|nr:hypothetical protein [Streptomyces sp. LBL]MDH6622223.1 hypothetical protein [Streptomyces sp. LBL]